MKCDDIGKWVLLGLSLTAIADIIFLLAEVAAQICDEAADKEQEEQFKKLQDEIDALRTEIVMLKK